MFKTFRLPTPLLAAALLVAACEPSSPGDEAVAVAEDLAVVLNRDLSVLADDSMAGRAVGTEGNRRARDYIVAELRAVGLEPALDTFTVERRGETLTGVNIRVSFPGTAHPDRYIMALAHYDHVGVRDGEIYNGADDNASGTAGLLMLAREWAQRPPYHTITALFTDAEEGGLRGARHFVAEPPFPIDEIVLAVNMDMVGQSSADLWVAGTWPWPSLRPLVERVEPMPPVVLHFGHDTPDDRGGDNWTMASDHGPFHQAGVPFLYFGVEDHPHYHRPTDEVGTIDPVFHHAAVETVRRVIAEADASLGGQRSGSGR